jgi:peptidoglycan/LPS O-acetylase OafA/YrhL
MNKATKLPVRSRPSPLPESSSLLLDVMRLGAALLVVVGHATHAEFRTGANNVQILGDVSVPVFFVLSGFVIRFVTRTRESNLRVYLIDRASRIYSVVLPALALTLVVSGICFLIDRVTFVRDWTVSFNHPFGRILFNLSFLSQAWGRNIIPFIDSPFWSLGYECFYYVLYGVLFFTGGMKRVVIALLLCMLIGPQVLLLAPIWWLGCWVYDLYQKVRGTPAHRPLVLLSAVTIGVAIVLNVAGYPQLLHLPMAGVHWAVNKPSPISYLNMDHVMATNLCLVSGIYATVLLFFALLAVDPLAISRTSPAALRFRRIADGTFAIYLMHYPMLVLALFLGLLVPHAPLRDIATVALVCVLLVFLAIPLDRLKNMMRKSLFKTFSIKPYGTGGTIKRGATQ